MSATKTSLAWQGFRHSNLVSTSSPAQARSGDVDDSDEAEEDGFVGADSSGPQEMMMEIMDKYVQAGEALAEKENDVRHLTKQVVELKASNGDLEERVAKLVTSNEKLADDEGRWYSLARELENQMDVIKKGETYTLFQDKVDEAEARLEVATDSNNVSKRRLYEVYSVVDKDFKNRDKVSGDGDNKDGFVNGDDGDGGDQTVDEHHQHATILRQLQELKSSVMETEAALTASRDAVAKADLERKRAEDEETASRDHLSTVRDEAAARDAAARLELGELREAAAKQTGALRQALEEGSLLKKACATAEARAKANEEARCKAVEDATMAEERLGDALDDLKLAQEETLSLQVGLAEARAACEASQEEGRREAQARRDAESSLSHHSERSVELERLLEETKARLAEVERDFAKSLQQVDGLARTADGYREEILAAAANLEEVKTVAARQEAELQASLKRGAELEDALQAARSQVEERNRAVNEAHDEMDRLSQTALKASEQVMELQQDLETSAAAAAAMEDYSVQAHNLREDLRNAKAEASAGQGYAAQVEELRKELERSNAKASAEQKYAAEVQELRQELVEMSSTTASAAREASCTRATLEATTLEAVQLREELEMAVAAASAAQENAAEAAQLREELKQVKAAAAAAASAAQDSALEMEDLREELEMANTAASAAQEYAEEARELRLELVKAKTEASAARENAERWEELRQGLDRAEAAAASAERDASNWHEACLAAESSAARADKARVDAEALLDALRQSLAGKEADMEEIGMRAAQTDGTLVAAEDAAKTAMQALAEAREDVLRAEARSTAAEQAREQSLQEVSRLLEAVRVLEMRLAEATAYVKEMEGLSEGQRGGLESSNKREGELERSLLATRAELDEMRTALARVTEEAATAAAAAAAADAANSQCTDVLFGSAGREHSASNGGESWTAASAPAGPAPVGPAASTVSRAEAEQLQAHAEAMELELRYTLESFEGQLSAMAREKVAIQKQVKELTGQCATLRRQASHYKKAAKESEAQVEQMLELQQQLADAESAAASLRDANSDLASKIDVLQANSVNATLWRRSEDEVLQLRGRLAEVEESNLQVATTTSQKLAASAEAVGSMKAHASDLEARLEEAEAELSAMRESAASTARDMAAAANSARDTQGVIARVPKLEAVAVKLEGEKTQLMESLAAATRQVDEARGEVEELEEALRLVRDERAEMLESVQRANESRAALAARLEDIASLVGCGSKGEADVSFVSIGDEITNLKSRVSTAEQSLERTAQALEHVAAEGGVELESGSSWIVNGVKSLGRRLQLAESSNAKSGAAHDGAVKAAKTLEDLSVVLECDGDWVVHKVHELKTLSHEMLELRDVHLKEIRQLKEEALIRTSSNATTLSQMFPADEVAEAREEVATLQVEMDSLRHELLEVQQMRAKDVEKHRREEARLQDRYDSLTRFVEGGANVGEGGARDPGMRDRRKTVHRKSSSLHIDASTAIGWLAEQGEEGPGGEVSNGSLCGTACEGNGHYNQWVSTPPAGAAIVRSTSIVIDQAAANGGGGTCGGSDTTLLDAAGSEASKAVAVLVKVQALLGCSTDEVMMALKEQQAASEELQLTVKILGMMKHSYLNNMDSLKSAIGEEAACEITPLLAQASDMCSKRACLTSVQEGLEALDEATCILAELISNGMNLKLKPSVTPNQEVSQVALDQAQADVASLNETLRKERLMMMAFRRWGQFYLAMSNEALRKRTQERNHARGLQQKPPLENASQATTEHPHNARGRSRRPSSASAVGRVGEEHAHVRQDLSSDEIQKLVEQEAERVARELAEEPSSSLLALSDARREMDDMAMKAQATLRLLYARPAQAQAHVHDVSTETTDMPPTGMFSGDPGAAGAGYEERKLEDNQGYAVAQDYPGVQDYSTVQNYPTVQDYSTAVQDATAVQGTVVPSPGTHGCVDIVQNYSEVSEAVHVAEAEGINVEVDQSMRASPSVPNLHHHQQQPNQKEADCLLGLTEEVVLVAESLASDSGPSASSEQDGAVSSLGSIESSPVSSTPVEPAVSRADGQNGATGPPQEEGGGATGVANETTGLPPPPTAASMSAPPISPPPMDSMVSNGANGATGSNPAHGRSAIEIAQANAPKGRTTGPLVEDGISKAERAEFLRKQREERKANRRKGMQAARSAEPSLNSGLRNRRTSAPGMMTGAFSAQAMARPAALPAVATPPATGSLSNGPDSPDSARISPVPAVDDNGTAAGRETPLQVPSAVEEREEHEKEHEHGQGTPPPPATADAFPGNEIVVAAPAVRAPAPPPRMFNPTSVPPPTAPPTATSGAQALPAQHPSIAFSIDASVERALTQARREAGLAERRATFWKCRFRDVAVWAASFAVLSYASDHGFEDC